MQGTSPISTVARRRSAAMRQLAAIVTAGTLAISFLSGGSAAAGAASPFTAGPIHMFGPAGYSEGIAADASGNIYLDPLDLKTGKGVIQKVSPMGAVLATIPIPAGPSGGVSLTGELFVPGQGVYVVDSGKTFGNPKTRAGRLLLVDPGTGAVKVVASGYNSPNNIAMDRQHNLYVGDLGIGTIYRVTPAGKSTVWAHGPLLEPAKPGQPGVDGIAFDAKQQYLYATNPGAHQLIRIAVNADGSAGMASVFANGAIIDARQQVTNALVGPDGLEIDQQGNIWVGASWVNQIQVISPAGALIAQYGSKGTAKLSNPCSLVFVGHTLYFSNLSLGIGITGSLTGKPTPGDKIGMLHTPYAGLPLTF